MKKISIPCVCIIALVALAVWAQNSEAYQTYSAQKDANDNPTGNCVSCHGDFDAVGYISRNDETPWFASLHVGHRAGMLNRDCNTCHIGDFSTRYPVSLNASNGGTGFEPISCVGCHGRQDDLNNGQIGAGLRQHHTNAGAAFCGGCHSDNDPGTFTPVGESAAPSYYFTPDAVHLDKPTDPCNANAGSIGQESVFGTIGLDNDGDLLYDGNDPDCQPCTSDADCDNGVFCDGAETCDTATGTCLAGTPPSCDDGVACTDDSCDPTLDDCLNTPNDATCDDNDVCNGIETCDPILDCQAGTPLDCDDGNLCTTDSCDPLTGCANDPVVCPEGEQCDTGTGECVSLGCTVDADCVDEFFCNGEETCDTATGTCLPGTPVDCDDGVGCTVDTCDEVNDTCANTPDDASCDDGNVCNGSETCDPVNDCQPGTPLDCDDGNLCTTDSCDPLTGCANDPVVCPEGEQCDTGTGECVSLGCTVDADCVDEFFCNGEETCDTATGTCLPGTPPDCDDGVGCTMDTCDEVNDACVNTPDDASCDDGDVCNGIETCDPILDCEAGTPLDCDDGNLCTTDSCDAVVGCANVPVECPEGQQCDTGTGECVPSPCTVDADCDDGMFCNGDETCDVATGTCQPGTPPDCDDGVDCTVDTCDEVNDTCANTPDDSACPDDGLFCTGDEICDPAAGCVSTGDPCPEGTTCNEDTDTCDVVSDKVTICHKGKNTINAGAGAVAAHLRHGDTLGPCP